MLNEFPLWDIKIYLEECLCVIVYTVKFSAVLDPICFQNILVCVPLKKKVMKILEIWEYPNLAIDENLEKAFRKKERTHIWPPAMQRESQVKWKEGRSERVRWKREVTGDN